MSKKSKTKAKLKTKVKAKKAAKAAAHGKKTLKKTSKPKPRKPPMATKKEDEDRREKSKAGEINTGTEHPALRPDGTEYEEDPMATPPGGPLSPSEAGRIDQGGEVDLSGSPGSAGEHVPVIEPSRELEPGTTHENRPGREDSDPRETAARTTQNQQQTGKPRDTK